jgi:NADPH:quinone reductase
VVGSVGSPAKLMAARAYGYDQVVVRDELTAEAKAAARTNRSSDGAGFDVVVDPVGGPTRRVSLDLLTLGGRLVVMGNASNAADVAISANELWLAGKGVLGFNLAAYSATHPDRAGRALHRAIEAVLAGQVQVDISEPLPLADVVAAHRRIESGQSTGKLLLAVNP